MASGELPRFRILVMDGRIQSCLPVIKALRLKGHHVTIAESDPLCVGIFFPLSPGALAASRPPDRSRGLCR